MIFSEQLDSDVETWHKMRGAQMVAAMKIISLAFDIERKKLSYVPGPIEVWGYIMCPGNIIMGPWCSYSDYLLIFHKPKWVRNMIAFGFYWISKMSNKKKI